jgi:FKBP-type peptidyl-prolyl cis-trans isomerase FkpA
MRTLIFAALFTLIALPALAAGGPVTDEPKTAGLTEDQKTLYAVGLIMATQLAVFDLSPGELEYVKQGLADATGGRKPLVEMDAYLAKVQKMAATRSSAKTAEFLEKEGHAKGAVKTASGLVYTSLKEGSGPSPSATDTVKVEYRGTLISGTEFDSSYKAGKPLEIKLDQVIKCWSEGIPKMKTGGKARLVCPPELAYGERGSGRIPPSAALIFEVELLEVKK